MCVFYIFNRGGNGFGVTEEIINAKTKYSHITFKYRIKLYYLVGAFMVGKDSPHKYPVLQVHYSHLDMIPKDGDSSGIFLHYTQHPQPNIASVFLLGTSGYALRHSTTYFETACEMDDDREIHPFAFRTHTHSLGM